MSYQGGTRLGRKSLTAWEAMRSYPPIYVRILAKTGHSTALTDAEIAIASGLEIARVRQINFMLSWESVTLSELERFGKACKFDLFSASDRARVTKYDYSWKIRNSTPFSYLRKSPKWESELFPLFRQWQDHLSKKSCAA